MEPEPLLRGSTEAGALCRIESQLDMLSLGLSEGSLPVESQGTSVSVSDTFDMLRDGWYRERAVDAAGVIMPLRRLLWLTWVRSDLKVEALLPALLAGAFPAALLEEALLAALMDGALLGARIVSAVLPVLLIAREPLRDPAMLLDALLGLRETCEDDPAASAP